MEINKCAHQWRPGDDKRATFGIRDCPWQCVLRRGRRFCSRRLMPGVVVSKAARRVTSFLASWLNESHELPGCARARSCLSRSRCNLAYLTIDPRLVTTAQSLMCYLLQGNAQMAVESHGSVVRDPAPKAGGPGFNSRRLPFFFLLQLAYTNANRWRICGALVWLLSTQLEWGKGSLMV